MDLERAIRVAQSDIYRALAEGHELMLNYVKQNCFTRRTPSIQRSAMVTNYTKSRLASFPWAKRAHPVRAEFFLEHEDGVLRFRIHAAQLKKGDRDNYDPQNLRPTQNRVTAKGDGPPPDFLFLWFADGKELIDVWAVAPLGTLKVQAGTQRASYKGWSAAHRLPHVDCDLAELEKLSPDRVDQDVDLGLDDADANDPGA